MKKLFSGLFTIMAIFSGLNAEVITAGSFQFAGGQYFYNSAPGATGGNISFSISPTLKLNEKISGIFTYAGGYRGSKEVADLVGGGTLFQDSQSHLVQTKFIFSPLKLLKLKIAGSYRKQLLRETPSENWGYGLFDYNKINSGLEIELNPWPKTSFALGLDYFTIVFPNYQSLESQQSPDLGREQAGEKVLDSHNQMYSFRANQFLIKNLHYSLTAIYLTKNYPDQPVVTSLDGLSASEKRLDKNILAAFSLSYPVKLSAALAILVEGNYQYNRTESNQNHSDARQQQFIGDYYGYNQNLDGINFYFLIGKNPKKSSVIELGINQSEKKYSGRPAQTSDGIYLAEKLNLRETVLSLGYTQPLNRNLNLKISAGYINSESNNKYQTYYQYNYESADYYFGFSYEF